MYSVKFSYLGLKLHQYLEMDLNSKKTSVPSKNKAKSRRFIKRCCCSFHEENKSILYDYETQRRLPKSAIGLLKKDEIICNKSKYMCSCCLSKSCVNWSSSEQNEY